jgi:hypothetical protein
VGARDGRTQSVRACLIFFLHPKKPKKLKPNTLFLFFSTNSWYIDTCPEKKKNPGINLGQPAGKGRK